VRHLGSQYWLYGLGLTNTQKWTSWSVNGQVAGYVARFDGLNFVTVHGAGHMVPAHKPELGLELWKMFLNGTF